jgi:hypothetical protein
MLENIIATLFSLAAATATTAAPTLGLKPDKNISTTCNLVAFVTETDPAGLNVRQKPSTSGKILGVLPPIIDGVEIGGVMAGVHIISSNNGWFKIDSSWDNSELTGKPQLAAFSGEGWISGRKLTVKSMANHGYAEPNVRSAIVLKINGGMDNGYLTSAGQLIACQGHWALVEYSRKKMPADMTDIEASPAARKGLPKGHFRAWVHKICGIQETSCDGLGNQDAE